MFTSVQISAFDILPLTFAQISAYLNEIAWIWQQIAVNLWSKKLIYEAKMQKNQLVPSIFSQLSQSLEWISFRFQAERDTECITLDSYVRHFSLFLTFLLIKWKKTNLQQFLIINDIISMKNKAAFALYHFKLNIFGVLEWWSDKTRHLGATVCTLMISV